MGEMGAGKGRRRNNTTYYSLINNNNKALARKPTISNKVIDKNTVYIYDFFEQKYRMRIGWTQMKKSIAGVALVAGVLCLAAKGPYRDLVQNYGFQDFKTAGFLPSYFCTVSLSLLFAAIRWNKKKGTVYSTILAIVTGSLLYEFFPFSTLRVFDILDVLAIIAGGFTSLVIAKLAIDKQLQICFCVKF